ncbi:uncharacterized protein [Procambarus clarkii]|uniref:uncharacterized protein isoform X1 n=2 Tax=Procambarus clarkii TaxID=6728 RepID=UPI001E67848B|nr:uncharacterized protein LOC123759583 isoform X1 [Procambarus clarkii]
MTWYSSPLVCYVEAAPKTVSEHKINFGWPNFFNPEMGMMREKGAKKGDSSREEEQGNELDTSQEKDDYEALVDYTLKGGLRGTLLLLNSTTMGDVGNLTDSEVVDLTEAAAKVMQEEDKQDAGGSEVTAEGVRLRMPLVRKKHTPELGKYGAKVTFYASEEPTKFIYYGNWCGKGGRSAPVDNLDRCCLDHDKCYGRLVRQCPDVWDKPYGRMYAWTLLEQETVCVRSESFCVNHVCDCDRQAAKCFNHYLSTPSEIATHLGTKTS